MGINGFIKNNSSNGTWSVKASIPSSNLIGTYLPPTITASSLNSFGVNPDIGAATGTSYAVTGSITSKVGGVGYTKGNGEIITQATKKLPRLL